MFVNNVRGGDAIGEKITSGRYDMVTIVEAPSDEAATTALLRIGSGGSVRTETLKAYPEDQYQDIIAKI